MSAAAPGEEPCVGGARNDRCVCTAGVSGDGDGAPAARSGARAWSVDDVWTPNGFLLANTGAELGADDRALACVGGAVVGEESGADVPAVRGEEER